MNLSFIQTTYYKSSDNPSVFSFFKNIFIAIEVYIFFLRHYKIINIQNGFNSNRFYFLIWKFIGLLKSNFNKTNFILMSVPILKESELTMNLKNDQIPQTYLLIFKNFLFALLRVFSSTFWASFFFKPSCLQISKLLFINQFHTLRFRYQPKIWEWFGKLTIFLPKTFLQIHVSRIWQDAFEFDGKCTPNKFF